MPPHGRATRVIVYNSLICQLCWLVENEKCSFKVHVTIFDVWGGEKWSWVEKKLHKPFHHFLFWNLKFIFVPIESPWLLCWLTTRPWRVAYWEIWVTIFGEIQPLQKQHLCCKLDQVCCWLLSWTVTIFLVATDAFALAKLSLICWLNYLGFLLIFDYPFGDCNFRGTWWSFLGAVVCITLTPITLIIPTAGQPINQFLSSFLATRF